MNNEWKYISFVIIFLASFGYWRYDSEEKNPDQMPNKAPHFQTYGAPEGIENMWPLLPPKGSKRLLLDEPEFRKALPEAEKGDMEYMIGLIDWYSRHGQVEVAEHWAKRRDEERSAHGLPSMIDSLSPVMHGDRPIPQKKTEPPP